MRRPRGSYQSKRKPRARKLAIDRACEVKAIDAFLASRPPRSAQDTDTIIIRPEDTLPSYDGWLTGAWLFDYSAPPEGSHYDTGALPRVRRI